MKPWELCTTCPDSQLFVLRFPTSTSWALLPPAHGSRITSLLCLLCYIFTLFFDYCSLLWTPIISLLEFLFHIDCAFSPDLGFALIGSSLFSINIFSWHLPCWTFLYSCLSLSAFVFVGLWIYLSLSHGYMTAFFSDFVLLCATSIGFSKWSVNFSILIHFYLC